MAFRTLLLGLLVLFPGISTALTSSGTTIPNTGTVVYTDGTLKYTMKSNETSVTVSTVVRLSIREPRAGSVLAGKTIRYAHTITNRGNSTDTIDIEAVSSLGFTVALLDGNQQPLHDTDGDGRPDTGPLDPGSRFAFFVQLTAGKNAVTGQTDDTVVSAVSSTDVKVRHSNTDRTMVIGPNFWDPLIKTVSPQGKVSPGTMVTYTNTFGNSGSAPATGVVITDVLDPNLVFVAGSESLPQGLPGASVAYDDAAKTVTWTIPSVPAGYVGSVQFRAQIDPATPCDTVIQNRIGIRSDQTPLTQYSNTVETTVVEQPLRISKTASRREVEVGDPVVYTVIVENVSKGTTIQETSVTDYLPKGFRYVQGSTTVEGRKAPDPDGGTTLAWSLGSIGPGQTRTLTYRVVVSISALLGSGVNTAWANAVSSGATRFSSGPASVEVTVKEGMLNGNIIVLGRVFLDKNGDRMPDKDEPGLRGVRVYLEDGSYAITDGDGKYSFNGLLPGDHVLKLDRASIPRGYRPVPLDNSFAGDGGTRFVSAPLGGLMRGDFGLVVDESEPGAAEPPTGNEAEAAKRTLTFGTALNPAPQTLEQQILTMPATPEILEPKQGAVLMRNWSDIVVRVPGGVQQTVTVNGSVLSEKQIGKKISESRKNLLILQYVGIHLNSGANRIVLETKRPDGSADRQEIEVTVPGDAGRIVISPDKADIPADGKTTVTFTVRVLDNEGRPIFGEETVTVLTGKGLILEDDLDPATPGHQIRSRDGGAVFNLRSTFKTGDDTVLVTVGSLPEARASVFFTPELRDWIVVGLGSVRLSGKLDGGNMEDISETDDFEQGVYQKDRLAFFLKGKILGKYLLTAAYDSEKEKRDQVFQEIDPERYYPIYGDASEQGYEAEAQGKLYVKLERGKSSVMVGDYQTDLTQTEFARYERPFYGVKADVREGKISAKAFATSTNQTRRKDEIPGNGTSGYYFLSAKPLIENSETVRIEIRDRYHSERVLSSVDKGRYTDYSIDYRNGTILFKEPVPTTDRDLNPVTIIVTYESISSNDEYYIYGGRVSVTPREGAEVGVTAVVEQKELKDSTLFGVDAAVNLAEKTVLKGEAARSETFEAGTGNAWKLELQSEVKSRLGVSAYYRKIDENFRNLALPDSEMGTKKYGLKLGYRYSEAMVFGADAYREENDLTGVKLTEGSVGVTGKYGIWNLTGGYRFVNEEDMPGTSRQEHMLYAGIGGNITSRLSASVLREQALTSTIVEKYPTLTQIKLDYVLTERMKAFLTQEFREEVETRRNTTTLGLETRLWKNVLLNSGYQMESGLAGETRRAIMEVNSSWGDERGLRLTTRTGYMLENALSEYRGQAILGLSTRWQIREGMSIGASAERYHPVQGDGGGSTAITVAAEYLKPEQFKVTGRYELRVSDPEQTSLVTFGSALKFSPSVSLLGKVTYWNSQKDSGTDALLDSMLGIAYRPLGRQSIYLLSLVKYKLEKQGSLPGGPQTNNIITSSELSYRLSPWLTVMGKYAGKLSWERLNNRKVTSYTDMLMGGATFDITDRIDVSGYAKIMNQYQSGTTSLGAVASVGYRLVKNVRVVAGYDFSGFSDRELSGENFHTQGPFVEVKFKFDEGTFTELCEMFISSCRKPEPPKTSLLVRSEARPEPVEVLGSAEAMTLVVNEKEVFLPSGDITIRGDAVDEIIEVKGEEDNRPVEFGITVSEPEKVTRWSLRIMSLDGAVIQSIGQDGPPPAEVAWEYRAAEEALLRAGEIYQYRLDAEYTDGRRLSSPVRLFGFDRASAVVVSLSAKAFQANAASLTPEAQQTLRETAIVLRKYPREKIVVEGFADSVGSEETNRELAQKRSQTAAAFLVSQEGIPKDRIIVRWYAMAASLSVRNLPDARKHDGRVEIRGESRYTDRPVILDQHRTAPFARINRASVTVDGIGRFTQVIDGDGGRIEIEMGDDQGRSVLTTVPLPTISVVERAEELPYAAGKGNPSGGLQKPGGTTQAPDIAVPHRVKGRTERGNSIELDDTPVAVAEDGTFVLPVNLRNGENIFWIKVRNAEGYTRLARLTVTVSLKTVKPLAPERGKENILEKIFGKLTMLGLVGQGDR